MTASSRAQWAEKLGQASCSRQWIFHCSSQSQHPSDFLRIFFQRGEGGLNQTFTEMVTIYAHNTIIIFANTSQGYISVLGHNYNQKTAYCRIMHLPSNITNN